MKICPYCEAEIANNAKKCKHCWEIVVEEKKVRQCPYCEAELSETAKKCKFCGEWLDKMLPNRQDEKNWFSWRINRMEFFIVFVLIYIITAILLSICDGADSNGWDNVSDWILIFCLFLPYVWLFPRRIKRFHDIWSSWWACLWYLFIWLYWIFDLFLIFNPGQKQKNKYGDVTEDNIPIYVKIIFIILFIVILYFGIKGRYEYLQVYKQIIN